MPLLSLGEESAVREALLENMRVIGNIDADFVITACPACALVLKEELPRLLGAAQAGAKKLAAKVREVHQLLTMNPVNAERAHDAGESGEPTLVTWHDSCHLRHQLDVAADPREIIARLPGVEYVESGAAQSCCGGGGLFSLMHYDLSQSIGLKRAGEIAASGAEIVATGCCPPCRMHLTEVLARVGVRTRFVHTVDLLAARSPAALKI